MELIKNSTFDNIVRKIVDLKIENLLKKKQKEKKRDTILMVSTRSRMHKKFLSA